MVSESFVAELMVKYENDKDVKEYKKIIELNYKRLFKFEVPDFKFEYPKEFSKDEYMTYLKVSYLKFRFDVYKVLEEIASGRQATEEEMKKAINAADLAKIKEDVYVKLGFP